MANKQKILKKLLATASAVAVLTAGVESAQAGAAIRYLQQNNADTTNGGHFGLARGVAAATAVQNGDHLIADGKSPLLVNGNANFSVNSEAAALGITLGGAGVNNVGLAGTTGAGAITVTFGHANNVLVLGTNGTPTATFVAPAGVVGHYDNLHVVDFNNFNATFQIDTANVSLATKFTCGGGNTGKIVVNADGVTFNKQGANEAFDVANSPLNLTIKNGNTATFKTNIKLAEDLILGHAVGGSGTAVINAVDADRIVNVRAIIGNAADLGILNFVAGNNHTITITNGVGVTNVPAAQALNSISITGGTVNFLGTARPQINATIITLGDAGVMQLSNAAQTVTGNIAAAADGNGQIFVSDGNAQTIIGNLGAANKNIGSIKLADNANSILAIQASAAGGAGNSDVSYNVDEVIAVGANNGTLTFTADHVTIGGTIGTAANSLALVQLVGGKTVNGAMTATLTGQVTATKFDISSTAATSNTLNLAANSSITGNVVQSGAGGPLGIIQVKGNSTITGSIGAAAPNKLSYIDFNADNATLTVGDANNKAVNIVLDTVDATKGIKFTNAGTTLAFATTGDVGITGIVSSDNTASKGKITWAGAAGKTLTFNNAAKFNTLDLTGATGADATVVLTGAGAGVPANAAVYGFKMVHADGTGILNIAGGGGNIVQLGDANMVADLGAQDLTKVTALNKVTFAANTDLVIKSATNIFTQNGITGANTNNITFQANSTIGGNIGTQAARLGTLLLNGANVAVNLQGDVYATTATIGDGMILTLGGTTSDITNIDATAAGVGTLVFQNSANTVYTGAIGAKNSLAAVQIASTTKGKTVTVNDIDATTIAFTNANVGSTLVLSNAALDVTGYKFTSAGSGIHNVQVSNGVTFGNTEYFGTAAKPMGNLMVAGAKTVNIQTDKFYGGITSTSGADQLTVNLNKAGATAYNIGDATNRALAVNVLQNATVNGLVYAKNMIVTDAQTLTFAAGLNSLTDTDTKLAYSTGIGGDTALTLGTTANAAGTTVNFADGALVDGQIATSKNNAGVATFAGSAIINADIGATNAKLQTVTFSDTSAQKTAAFNGGNIYASTITFAQTQAMIKANTTLNGATTFNGTSIQLGQNSLTLTGGAATMTGDVQIGVTTYNGTTGGRIVAGEGTALSQANANVNITVDGTITTAAGRFVIFDFANNGSLTLDATKIKVASATPDAYGFVSYAFLVDGNKGYISTQRNTQQGFLNVLNATNAPQNVRDAVFAIADPRNTGDALALAEDWETIARTKGADAMVEAAHRGTTVPQIGQQASTEVFRTSSDFITTRMGQQQLQSKAMPVASAAGVNSGDDDDMSRYGAWVTPFYVQAQQRLRNDVAGYSSRSAGGLIGFDTKANDTLTIGIAAGGAQADVKHKNFLRGDKTKVKSFMFSIYASQDLTENWYLQGVATFGSSKVTNQALRIASAGNQTAKGKYDSNVYGGEVLAGYNYNVADNTALTPVLGLSYARISDSGYKETGTSFNNLTVSKRNVDQLEVVAGARIAMSSETNGVDLLPEVHGFVRQDLVGKNPKVPVRLDGLYNGALPPKAAKKIKTIFNPGFALTAKTGLLEYGLGYDAHIGNKYTAHQGTLKVRVNF